jgi:CheY-like chemotaxis protein
VVTDFREMHPNRAENYCCTGGGGAMSMSEYTPRRLQSARVKADQLRATGAEIVVTSCHNCVDGLTDCIRHYKLGMQVTQLVNLVANAIVVPARVNVPSPVGQAVAAVPAPLAAAPLAGRTVLVVDDEPDALLYYASVLEDNGARVLQAPDGETAIALARSEKLDLVTLDLSMPGMDGGAVFETIRRDPELAALRVCIITGKPELRRLIYDRPVPPPEGYLDKPVDEETLLFHVRRILDVH